MSTPMLRLAYSAAGVIGIVTFGLLMLHIFNSLQGV